VTIATAATGHDVSVIMRVRSVLLPMAAVVLYRLTVAGSPRATERARALTVIMPIAVVSVDLIRAPARSGTPPCRQSA
jgi:hypothetical protein